MRKTVRGEHMITIRCNGCGFPDDLDAICDECEHWPEPVRLAVGIMRDTPEVRSALEALAEEVVRLWKIVEKGAVR